MAKELPYFRFTVQEWQNGKISLEDYELKGLFIDVCGYYWVQDCSITIAMLEKRFRSAKDLLNQLLDLDIIKVTSEGVVNIGFLIEQYDILSEKRKKRQIAGKKGGLSKSSNAKAMLKQSSSYKDKDKDNNTVALFDEKYITFSLKFYEKLKEYGKITKAQKPESKSWIKPIRDLEVVDKIDWDKIRNAATYYFDNIEDKYIPEIRSTKSFRDKYDNLKSHHDRNK